MQLDLSTVTFDTRQEVRDVLTALDEYIKNHKKDTLKPAVQELADLLDYLDMSW